MRLINFLSLFPNSTQMIVFLSIYLSFIFLFVAYILFVVHGKDIKYFFIFSPPKSRVMVKSATNSPGLQILTMEEVGRISKENYLVKSPFMSRFRYQSYFDIYQRSYH